jgi:hypothetical protein
MRSRDEFEEVADEDGRDELVAEITQLYEKNLRNPTEVSVELERVLRVYLETADSLLDAHSDADEQEIDEILDQLDDIIASLRATYIQEASA